MLLKSGVCLNCEEVEVPLNVTINGFSKESLFGKEALEIG